MKKMSFLKFTSSVLLGAMFFILTGTGEVKAVLQSNGNEGATYNVSEWLINIRKMEELGGAMGLNESINEEGLTAIGESNNIDIHMQKNTEYGALAILSASSYGNPNKIEDGDTTTGNATGAVMHLNSEWVATGTINEAKTYVNAKERYKNLQTSTYVQQKGDAITETAGWHGSEESDWIRAPHYYYHAPLNNPNDMNGLLRSSKGSIFSYTGAWSTNATSQVGGTAHWTYEHYTRAVVVSGQGL